VLGISDVPVSESVWAWSWDAEARVSADFPLELCEGIPLVIDEFNG
jgi:hypothetical protein